MTGTMKKADTYAVGSNSAQSGPWYGGVSAGGGISASTPIVAALFNRIFEERLRAGKTGPLDFINPAL